MAGRLWDFFRKSVECRAGSSLIANQEEHHKRISFQDAFRATRQRYGIAPDERCARD
jgi:hypothetical protein